MKNYFKRLKEHPGLRIASVMSVLSFLAAWANKNIHSVDGVIIVGFSGTAFFFLIVLLTNFRK